jgi:uncharacterized protein YndB with AHSA1/START domain
MGMRVQKSIIIKAPPEKIWPFLVEPDRILKWCSTFKEFKYTSKQHSGIGTTVYVKEQAGGPLMKLNFKVTEWLENERLAFSMTSGSVVKSYKLTWSLLPAPSGSMFVFTEQVELPFGVIGKLIGAIGQRSAEAHVKEYLSRLKSLAEG